MNIRTTEVYKDGKLIKVEERIVPDYVIEQEKKLELEQSDIEDVPRIAEDIWSALKAKGIVSDSDLPKKAREKLAKRMNIRNDLTNQKEF